MMAGRVNFEQAREALRNWVFQNALPLWSSRGVDAVNGGFIERLLPDGSSTEDPRRARVVGRQIFSFAAADRLGWDGEGRKVVRHGLDALENQHFTSDGMIVPLVAPGGQALKHDFDLYDYAFVLFGLAAAHRIGETQDRVAARANKLLTHLEGWKHPKAGFEEANPRTLPLKANPHMHMLEASLAWGEFGIDERWDALADEVAGLCLTCFLDPQTGALKEFFDGEWRALPDHENSVVEPGHQFEWAWLLIRWGILRQQENAIKAGRRLIELAETHGVDSKRDLAINELNDDLSVRDDRARLWPQTERIKAHVALASIASATDERERALEIAAKATRGLLKFFDHPVAGAWWEHINAHGLPMREPSRSSSLYHIMCALDVMEDFERSEMAAG